MHRYQSICMYMLFAVNGKVSSESQFVQWNFRGNVEWLRSDRIDVKYMKKVECLCLIIKINIESLSQKNNN